MSKNIHTMIQIEYEKKQKSAFDSLMLRKEEIYSKIPRLQQIEAEINFTGIRHNKAILNGAPSVSEAIDSLEFKINELREEKQNLLAQYGYPLNYLDIAYECAQCKDTGFIHTHTGSEKCICYKQLYIDHLYAMSNLSLTRTENFTCFNENYYADKADEKKYGLKVSPRENILRIKNSCLKFIENFDNPQEKNLFFSGLTGVGKTFMTYCTAYELINKGRTVLYQTAPMLFNIINEYKAKSFKEDEYQDESYKNIFNVELLIIDDLGTESLSASRYAEFLTILNTRQANDLSRPCKTIISTNISIKQLHEYYDERVASRIIGCFDIYRFVGEDIRRLKKLGATAV